MREIQESEYRMLDRITDRNIIRLSEVCDYMSEFRGSIWGSLDNVDFQNPRYRYYVREIVTRDHN